MSERVPMLSVADAVSAAKVVGIREHMAGLSVYRILLRHPALATAVNQLLTTLLFTGNKLDARLRELLIMRIGWVTGANYEWTQHWHFARRINIPSEDILAVRNWQSSDRLSPADRAVLAAVDDTLECGAISDETWRACVEHVGTPEQLVEMVVAIGNWNMFSQLLKSLKVPLEEGVASWPPDGVQPKHADL